MTPLFDPVRDLQISRLIPATPEAIWRAWTEPVLFERWWVPAPARCRVIELDLRPGGGLVTELCEGGGPFVPHLDACFLDVEAPMRLVFTNALVKGYRPAAAPFMTAIVTLSRRDHGTEYAAHVMHKDADQKALHARLGFDEGWGTVIGQLAVLVADRDAVQGGSR